ncbi:MAG: hypothetical protein JWP11_3471 [Frankiales bacterium]|nr:hypothetical protein [Frankiales bacterium]
MATPIPHHGSGRYLKFALWCLVAVFVWCAQYMYVVPLACLPVIAQTPGARKWGYVAILLFGFGWIYSIMAALNPRVPRDVVRPWGFSRTS